MVTEAAPAPRDRTRLVGVLLWTGILLVAAAIAAVVVFVQRYEPLVDGSMGGISRNTKDIETYGGMNVQVITPWEEGARFFAGFTVRNDGPVGVTVKRFLEPWEPGHDGQPDQGFEPVSVVLGPKEEFAGQRSVGFEDYVEFSPFELEPGDERRVAIQYQLNDCIPRNGWLSDDSVSVRFSLWGMDRDTEFMLPFRLAADGKYREGC